MTEMNQERLETLREQFPQGTRIQCMENKDGIPVPTGEKGTLEHIDELGLFHCNLDDGRKFVAAIDEGCFQAISPKQPEQCRITVITKDTYWTLIDQAKAECGQNQDAFAQWLEDRLMEMGPEQALNFSTITDAYEDLANKYGLWSAAVILCDGCSDDGFFDFRCWLIAQGREVYMAALKDPNSLADVPAYGGCCFETMGYVGICAYKKLTGRDPYKNFDFDAYDTVVDDLEKDIVYGVGIDYPCTWSETASYVPRLCAKYLTPEELAWRIKYHNDQWNITSPEIKAARAMAQESKKSKKNRSDAR